MKLSRQKSMATRFSPEPAGQDRAGAPHDTAASSVCRPARRQALVRLGSAVGALGLAILVGNDKLARAGEGREVAVEVRRFQFSPNEIVLKRGETVTLAFRSLDFVHGFNAPDFGVRADLLPGQVTRVRLQPDRLGRFAFLCDNFCGDGHEQMGGLLIVEA